jgi:hypothetical protein
MAFGGAHEAVINRQADAVLVGSAHENGVHNARIQIAQRIELHR